MTGSSPQALRLALACVVAILAAPAAQAVAAPASHTPAVPASKTRSAQGIHKIKHVVIIMQENRSFDNYFGTFPGADGIPGLAGNPGRVPCVPDPLRHRCARPYHDPQDVDYGGPHEQGAFNTDFDNGRMDGFVRAGGRTARTRSIPRTASRS